MFKEWSKSLDFIGFLGWKRRIYTLFTPLEDQIGNQDMEKGKIRLKNLKLMNASIKLRSKHRLTRAHREKQLKMSCQALHNAPPNLSLIHI